MYLFIKKGLRGGTSYIAKRYNEANNKYFRDYDPTKPSKFISYLDMNNLNSCSITGYLPYGGFKWLQNVDNFDVNSISEKSRIGYILDFHLEYLKELHLLHNDYLLPPGKPAIPFYMLSEYFKKAADEYVIKVSDVVKLIPHLGNKLNYILDCRNRQLYLPLGMKLTEIHLTGTKNILILTLKKKKMLLLVLTFKTYLKVKRLF